MDEVTGAVQLPPFPCGFASLAKQEGGESIWAQMTLERASYDPPTDMLTATVILSYADWDEGSVIPYRKPVGEIYFGFLGVGWGFDAIDPLGEQLEVYTLKGAVEGYATFLRSIEILPRLLEGEDA